MEFIRVGSTENCYWEKMMEIYKTSFPLFEQRTIEAQIDVLKDDKYNCVVICEEELIIGILFYWEFENYRYIEHLAISANLRGKNYGSKVLKKFCDYNGTIILEIDPPVDDISVKRLNFYSNLGFTLQEFNHIHPPYRKEYEGHSLKIMSYNKNISEDEYSYFNVFLKDRVMKYSGNS